MNLACPRGSLHQPFQKSHEVLAGVPRSRHRLQLAGFEILGVWLPNFIPGPELNIAGNFCTFNPVLADGSPA